MTAILPTTTITAAAAGSLSGVVQMRPGPGGRDFPASLSVQANFVYGSGGTSVDAWLQTSLDGGGTWIDIANFHFLVASARFVYNLSSATPVTTEYTPTDGTLGANTAKDGIIGTLFRVKYTSVGTYAGGTTLRLDIVSNGITAQS